MTLQNLYRSKDFWAVTAFFTALFALDFFAFGFIHLAHFWDEAWVYVPALKEMSLKGVSLFPNTIPLDLTRGHPLLFHFIGGWWYRIFGLSNESGHLFALFISNLTLITVFFGLRKVIGALGGLFAALFIIVQPIFIAQSAMVFPEMALTLFVLLAFFSYHQQRTWAFVLTLSCALYIKESALVYFIAFFLWDLFRVIFLKDSYRLLLKFIVPVLVILSHPVILFLHFDWFLFPEHTSLILDNLADVQWQLRRVFEHNFHEQGREWMFFPLMALTVLASKIRPFWVKLLLIAAAFAAFKVLFIKWVVPDWAFVAILSIVCVAPPFVWWRFRKSDPPSNTTHFLAVGYLALVGYVVFSAINFFTIRYLLSSIVLTAVLVSVGLWKSALPSWSKAAISLALIPLPLYYTYTERTLGEINLGLYDDLVAQQNAVNWMVENAPQDAWVCTNFVSAHYLLYSNAGYLEEGEQFERLNVHYCLAPCETEYVYRACTVADCKIDQDFEADGYKAVFIDTVGVSSVGIYQRSIK